MYVLRVTCYATSSIIYSIRYTIPWETGSIITFAQFEEGNLLENKLNAEEDELVLASIDESFIDNDYDDGSTSMDTLKYI